MKVKMLFTGIFVSALMAGDLFAVDRTYDVDENACIHNWLILPAISLDENASNHTEEAQKAYFDKEFFKDQNAAKPSARNKVKVGDNELTWVAIQTSGPILEFIEPANNSIYFGTTYIVCDQDIPDVIISIGSDDSSLWKLNGTELIRTYSGRGGEEDQNRSNPVTLKKGVNMLSMAVINGVGPSGACARLLDKDNNPVKNIKISLTPAINNAAPVLATK